MHTTTTLTTLTTLYVLTVLTLTLSTLPPPATADSAIGANPALRAAWLAKHNTRRAEYGLAPLEWSAEVADSAASHANGCPGVSHSATENGENICVGSAEQGPECVDRWAAEADDWDCATDTCGAGKVCGHYTQMVWEASVAVGCAARSGCQTGGFDSVAVCQYSPAGNVVGAQPFAAARCDTTPPPCAAPCSPPNSCSGVGSCCAQECSCLAGFQPSDASRADCVVATTVVVYGNARVGVPASVSSSVFAGHYTYVHVRPFSQSPGQSGDLPVVPPGTPFTLSIAATDAGSAPPRAYLLVGLAEPSDVDNVGSTFVNAAGTASEITYATADTSSAAIVSLGVTADADTSFTLTLTIGALAGQSEGESKDGLTSQLWFLAAVGGGALVFLVLCVVLVVCCIKKSGDSKQSYFVAGDTFIDTTDMHTVNSIGMASTSTGAVAISSPELVSTAPVRAPPSRPLPTLAPAVSKTALYDYEPANGDELALTKGTPVDVIEEFDDGWARGRCGGSEGVFPLSYVQ